MYLYCYSRSDKAREVGNKLLNSTEGEWINSMEEFCMSPAENAVRADGAIVMIIPVEAAVKLLLDRIYHSDVKYPVVMVDTDCRFAGIIRRSGYNNYEMLDKICSILDCKALTKRTDRSDFAPDLMKLVSRYNMVPSSTELLKKYTELIANGGNVKLYSDLPLTMSEPVLDSVSFSPFMFRYNQKKELGQAYVAATTDDAPSIFITCSTLPEIDSDRVLILTPKIIALGLELTVRTDEDYAVEEVNNVLIKHSINPQAISTVAVSSIVRQAPAVDAIAKSLECFVTSFDSRLIKAVKLPLNATYAPGRMDADTCTAAACLASDNGNIIIRRGGNKNSVILTATYKRGDISLT